MQNSHFQTKKFQLISIAEILTYTQETTYISMENRFHETKLLVS